MLTEFRTLSSAIIGKDLTVRESLTAKDVTTQAVQFDTTQNITPQTGQLTWNQDENTLNLGLNNDVSLQIGEETIINVKAAEDIKNGQCVYASGAVGSGSGNIEVSLYKSQFGFTSEIYFLGIATQDINSGDFGYVTTFGKVRGVLVSDTRATDDPQYALPANDGWEIGTILYPSVTDLGKYTQTRPSAPHRALAVVMIIAKSGNQRIFFVRSETGYDLEDLHNVQITNPQNGEVLTYNSSLSSWENTTGTWEVSGSNIFFNDGNVGIGTTEPTEKLSVAGNVAIGSSGSIVPDQSDILGWIFTFSRTPTSLGSNNILRGTFMSPDGTRFYWMDAGRVTRQYTLTTPYDIDSAGSSANASFTVSTAQDSTPHNIYFSNDGSLFFFIGSSNRRIYKYTLSTPWNINTAVFVSQSPQVSVAPFSLSTPTGLWFSEDGTKLMFCGGNNSLFCVNLIAPWDISDLSSYTETSATAGSNQSIVASSDGSKIYIVHNHPPSGNGRESIDEYVLSVPWDLTTISSTGNFLLLPFWQRNSTQLFWNERDNVGLLAGENPRIIRQISTAAYTRYNTPVLRTNDIRANTIKASGLEIFGNQVHFWSPGNTNLVVASPGNTQSIVFGQYNALDSALGARITRSINTLDLYGWSSVDFTVGGTRRGRFTDVGLAVGTTANPNFTLDVVGTANISSTLNVGGNQTAGTSAFVYGRDSDSNANYRRIKLSMTNAGIGVIEPEGAGTGATGNTLKVTGRFVSEDNIIEISTATVNLTYADHAGMYIRLTHADGPISIVLDFDDTIPKGAEYFFFKATDQPITFTGATVNGESRIGDVDQNSGFALKRVVTGGAFDLI
jgi:hypothetical protein